MVHKDPNTRATNAPAARAIQVIRHAQVCAKLQISSAKLFEMVARHQFPRPFPLIPGGRAVGWIEADVDRWILDRKATPSVMEAA
jgi:prophage regulatory protein